MIQHRRLFYLNSADRASGVDASNFTIQLPNFPVGESFSHVCLLEANIPKSYYMVQAGFNTFTLVELGQNITITLVPANYSATCFRACVTNMLNAASTHGWTYAITWPSPTEPATGKFTYTVTGNAGSQPSIVCTTNLHEALGFNANSSNAFAANTLVSTNVVKLQAEDALYLHSDIVTAVGNDVLQQLYTNGIPDFGMINYKCMDWQTTSKPMSTSTTNIFRFSLTDENNRVMNLNGLNFVMTLMVCNISPLVIPAPPPPPPPPLPMQHHLTTAPAPVSEEEWQDDTEQQ